MSIIYNIVLLVLCSIPLATLVPIERQRLHYETSPVSTSSSPIDCKGGWIFEENSYSLVGGWTNCTANVMVENGVIAIIRLKDQCDCNRVIESDYIVMDMCKNGEYVFGPGVHSFTYNALPGARFRFSARYQKTLFHCSEEIPSSDLYDLLSVPLTLVNLNSSHVECRLKMPEEINVRVSDVSGVDSKIVLSGVPNLSTLPGLKTTITVDFFRRREDPNQGVSFDSPCKMTQLSLFGQRGDSVSFSIRELQYDDEDRRKKCSESHLEQSYNPRLITDTNSGMQAMFR